MKKIGNKIRIMIKRKKDSFKLNYIKHESKRQILIRFLILFFVFISYFIFISWKYGINEGIIVTLLTWSFFVFCTPIADAGFLLDFPIRLITKIRMIYSEIFVWIIAFLINFIVLLFNPYVYEKTELLKLFKHIITTPFPFWIIPILSVLGTFLSIYFGDELIDVIKHKERIKYKKHKNKHFTIILLFIIVSLVMIYFYISKKIGIDVF